MKDRLVINPGPCSMLEQAEILVQDIGTDREWVEIGYNDDEGFAEVFALAHPMNAPKIVRAVNSHDELLSVVERLVVAWSRQPLNLSHFDGLERLSAMAAATKAIFKARGESYTPDPKLQAALNALKKAEVGR